MAESGKTEQILIHLEYLRKGQDEVVDHLRILNGRMGKSENRLTALETRADEAKNEVAKWGAGAGAAAAAFVAGLIAYFKGGQ